jgi:cytochrome P450
MAALDELVFDIIRAKREGSAGDDLLSRLLAAAEEEGGMTDQQLRDETVTMYVAGHETTALALTFCLRQLALHPQAQDRLREEIRTVAGDGPIDAALVHTLPFTQVVVDESMRLHPPVWAVGREPTEDTVIGGRACPRGTQLIISQWTLHRDARWFEDPLTWNPDRWLDGLAGRLPRFVYAPFGGGPRVCIGNHFAMLEVMVILATLMRDWAVSPVDDPEMQLLPSVTLRPEGEVRMAWNPA